jgi:hypothetical protein
MGWDRRLVRSPVPMVFGPTGRRLAITLPGCRMTTTRTTFARSLTDGAPPADLSPPLAALWWAAKGDWDRAHGVVQDDAGRDAAWVHAYLHRVEGDLDNAGYWYRRARREMASGPLAEEWDAIVAVLLAEGER